MNSLEQKLEEIDSLNLNELSNENLNINDFNNNLKYLHNI